MGALRATGEAGAFTAPPSPALIAASRAARRWASFLYVFYHASMKMCNIHEYKDTFTFAYLCVIIHLHLHKRSLPVCMRLCHECTHVCNRMRRYSITTSVCLPRICVYGKHIYIYACMCLFNTRFVYDRHVLYFCIDGFVFEYIPCCHSFAYTYVRTYLHPRTRTHTL